MALSEDFRTLGFGTYIAVGSISPHNEGARVELRPGRFLVSTVLIAVCLVVCALALMLGILITASNKAMASGSVVSFLVAGGFAIPAWILANAPEIFSHERRWNQLVEQIRSAIDGDICP